MSTNIRPGLVLGGKVKAEDLDLGLRVHALGYRTVVVPRAVVYHLHTLRTNLTPAVFAHTVRIVRNRYLSFFGVAAYAYLVTKFGRAEGESPPENADSSEPI
jgi:GT2 family glycosyltransferase